MAINRNGGGGGDGWSYAVFHWARELIFTRNKLIVFTT